MDPMVKGKFINKSTQIDEVETEGAVHRIYEVQGDIVGHTIAELERGRVVVVIPKSKNEGCSNDYLLSYEPVAIDIQTDDNGATRVGFSRYFVEAVTHNLKREFKSKKLKKNYLLCRICKFDDATGQVISFTTKVKRHKLLPIDAIAHPLHDKVIH